MPVFLPVKVAFYRESENFLECDSKAAAFPSSSHFFASPNPN
jgi:hypothetical protein